MRETLTLNTHEQKRVMILKRILAGQLSMAEAAPLLDRSHRQVQRMLAAYRKEGQKLGSTGALSRSPRHLYEHERRHRCRSHAGAVSGQAGASETSPA